jgi:ubiquinone/menaquinone biosynthesis C-methylase UbiE
MSNTVERFSNRVDNYIKYRPTYPPDVLDVFRSKMGLTTESVVADIGSGPGILTRLFLDNGNMTYGVEPNDGMRSAAERILVEFTNFKSINGTSEATTLADTSVDFITAGQAFHWFRPEPTKAEFRRILKPGGWVALIWNMRQLDSTPFLREYEAFIVQNSVDYNEVRHERIAGPLPDSPAKSAEPSDKVKMASALLGFFDNGFKTASYDNVQVFDFSGLKGRLFSSSYMPTEETENGMRIVKELRGLFDKHSENGKIKVFYDTIIFYSQL